MQLRFVVLLVVLAGGTFFANTSLGVYEAVFGGPRARSIVVLRDESRAVQKITLQFAQPVRRQELQPALIPAAHGGWVFENPLIENHLYTAVSFVPALPLKPQTTYTLSVYQATSILGRTGPAYTTTFQNGGGVVFEEPEGRIKKPEQRVVMLPIPMDFQDSSLSCEAASAKMALSFKGAVLGEETIMEKIGYDTRQLRKGDTWGDPHRGFVGDINGKICTSGFGVFWDAVARAVDNWKDGASFSGWSIQDLTRELAEGNPVMVWGTLPKANLRECSWYTKEGRYIKAFYETHVRLAIGFIGAQENPEQIILNDPLVGRLYWPTSMFEKNWSAFGYSGVAIR